MSGNGERGGTPGWIYALKWWEAAGEERGRFYKVAVGKKKKGFETQLTKPWL